MHKTYRYRLYPTRKQKTTIKNTLESLRWVYNETLAIKKNTYKKENKTLTLFDTNKLLTQWKKEHPELRNIHSQVLQNSQLRVDLAYKAFFRRIKNGEKTGYPRFKGKNRYDSLTYTQTGFELNNNNKTLKLSKIGNVNIKLHRPIEGKIKRLTISRNSLDKYFVSFIVEVDDKPTDVKTNAVVGIDLGLTTFATLSDNSKIDNPQFYKHEEKELAKAQQQLSKQKKGSSIWHKKLRKVRHIHERITNKRDNFIHQESRKLINKYDIICFENLNINSIKNNNFKSINKGVSDVAWSKFVNVTLYKAEEAGKKVILVNPSGTSQTCSKCGLIVKKPLSERVHKCSCGLVIDRDLNASINILRLGLESFSNQSIEAYML